MTASTSTNRRTGILGDLLFPDFQPFAFQTQRLLAEVQYGGGDATEAARVASQIASGDFESWYTQWSSAGEVARANGDEARLGGRAVTARSRYFAAANYFRTAEFFLQHDDPRAIATWTRMAEAFRDASEMWEPAFEWFDVEYGEKSLPGYFVRPQGSPSRRPTVVFLNGADGTKEESWFIAGGGFVERGVNFVTIDGPGQGGPLRVDDIFSRPDYEAAVSPVVDLVMARDDVDPDRVGLVGASMGGYYGARVAAYEKRFKAVALHGACFSIKDNLWNRYPPIKKVLKRVTGSASDDQAERALAAFDLSGHAEKITQPIYITHGTEDTLVDPVCANRLYDAVSSEDKTLKMWGPEGLGGGLHCSVDNPVEVFPELMDWMVDRL